MQFWEPCRKFSLKVPKFPPKVRRHTLKAKQIQKVSTLNCSSGHVRCSFDKEPENLPTKHKHFLLKVLKNFTKEKYLRKNFLSQNVYLLMKNAILTTLTNNSTKSLKFSRESSKIKLKRPSLFFKQKFFLKMFPWTGWSHFLLPCWKNFANSSKI